MRWHFVFPGHPVRAGEVDPEFGEQREAIAGAGFTTSLVPELDGRAVVLRGVPGGSVVVYRGWMLSVGEYGRMVEAVERAGARVMTSAEAYVAAHHLPGWYSKLADLTPETRVFAEGADLVGELGALGWPGYFVKDYVKSVKTTSGSIIREPGEITGMLAEMRRIRGTIEGGVCVRRVEAFVAETERRYFVVLGRAYASDGGEIPEVVRAVVGRIGLPFYSVDVVRRTDGVMRVVEIGDGQVSDLVGWTVEAFVAMWKEAWVAQINF